jgi:integrase
VFARHVGFALFFCEALGNVFGNRGRLGCADGASARRLRGHIEERPNGTFRAVVYAGIDPLTKKPRYLKKTLPSEAQAQVELTRMQNQIDEHRHPRSSITVGGVISKWLEVVELEDSSRERYEGLIRLYIAPTFGDLPAAKLHDAELLERFYARLRRCNRLCSGGSRRP